MEEETSSNGEDKQSCVGFERGLWIFDFGYKQKIINNLIKINNLKNYNKIWINLIWDEIKIIIWKKCQI